MNCSNIIEEDIVSSISKDDSCNSSIDYEEQNNVEASFDYNNIYEEEEENSDDDFEDEDDEEVVEEIEKETSNSSIKEKQNTNQQLNLLNKNGPSEKQHNNHPQQPDFQTCLFYIINSKSILKELTDDVRKQVEEQSQKSSFLSKQTFLNIKLNTFTSHINIKPCQKSQIDKERAYQSLETSKQGVSNQPLLQNQKKGIFKDNKSGDDILKQSNYDMQTKKSNQNSTNQNTQIQTQSSSSGLNNITNTSSIIDTQCIRNNSNQPTMIIKGSTNTSTSTSSKLKSVVTFELNKHDSIQSQDSHKRKQKLLNTDLQNSNQGESFRVLQSPRDSKSLPNIDKLKAKFNKLKQKPPKISSKSWIILNGKNKKLISGQLENQIREIASLTKMMTCYVVVNYIRKLNLIPEKTYFRVSAHAANQPGTSAELCEGELVSIMDLLYGMMLPSGNDAAFVLAENFGVYLFMQSDKFKEKYGNGQNRKKLKVKNPITYFIKEMNAFADKLNMQDTYFTNPHGLMHKKNRSTSYDVGLLAYQLIHDPLIRTIIAAQSYKASILTQSLQQKSPPTIWKNTNKLLKKNGFLGLKTGITLTAGPCLATWYKNDNVSFIVILLGTKSIEDRWSETIELVEWAKKQLIPQKEGK